MQIPNGFRYHARYLDRNAQEDLLKSVRAVVAEAPFYVPTMPRSGKPLSVEMTNCGPLGWLTDKAGGYRYQATHPTTGRPWPEMPPLLRRLWSELADYPAPPEACLVNYYRPGARLGSHQDSDEADTAAPVVSISLGDDAVFHVGGLKRGCGRTRLTLKSGDVVVLGGAARLAFHGVDRIVSDTSDLLVERGRINLTLRRVGLP
ncbi:MAG: alpha-ketoglutarate-dependent dioxygenase AlkB [Hyphomicrobiaceae bacterium]|nr:alpha-ketoglutarate-dependent dioxygenase AlkB [Hyphomicrobiaceae bacterium]